MTNSIFSHFPKFGLVLFTIAISCLTAICQNHGTSAEKTESIPYEIQTQLLGRWSGLCTYQSESKEFILDVTNNGTQYEYLWSIYQTGNISKKISNAGYSKETGEVTLDGFIFLKVGSNNEIQATLKRHDFVAEFRLKKIEKPKASFITENVSFTNKDATLAGTLYKPKGKGPHPAIVSLQISYPTFKR